MLLLGIYPLCQNFILSLIYKHQPFILLEKIIGCEVYTNCQKSKFCRLSRLYIMNIFVRLIKFSFVYTCLHCTVPKQPGAIGKTKDNPFMMLDILFYIFFVTVFITMHVNLVP